MGDAARFQSVQREAPGGRTQQAVTRIRMAFYDLLLGQEEVRLTENSLKRVRQSLEETRAMQEAGLSPVYDVLRLEVELANLDVDEAEVADFVRRSAADRSDLRQLSMTRDVRHAELRIEQVEYLPKVFVFGTYGLAARQNGTPDFFGSSQQRGSSKQVGLRVTVLVFSGFGRDARIDQMQTVLRQAETETRLGGCMPRSSCYWPSWPAARWGAGERRTSLWRRGGTRAEATGGSSTSRWSARPRRISPAPYD